MNSTQLNLNNKKNYLIKQIVNREINTRNNLNNKSQGNKIINDQNDCPYGSKESHVKY